MPSVPRYNEPQVRQGAIQGPRTPAVASLEAFGGGESTQQVFQAAQGVNKLGTDIANQEYENQYKSAVDQQARDVFTQLSQQETALKVRLSQAKGKDALAESQKILEDYDKSFQETRKGIINRDVAGAVDQRYAQGRQSLNSWATPYAAQEMFRYDNEGTLAGIKSLQEGATVDTTDAYLASSVAEQRRLREEFGRRNGLHSDVIAGQQAEDTSNTYASAIKAMIAKGDDLGAKRMYDALPKGILIGNDATQIAAQVMHGSKLGEATAFVDKLISIRYEKTTGGDIVTINPPESVTAALEAAKSIQDPETRKMAEQQIEHKFAVQERATQAQKNANFERLSGMLEKNGGDLSAIEGDPIWVDGLTHNERNTLRQFADHVASGGIIRTDPATLIEIDQLTRDELRALTPAKILEYRNKLSNHHFDQLREAIKKAGTVEKFDSKIPFNEMIVNGLTGTGVSGIPETATLEEIKKKPAWAKTYQLVRDAVEVASEAERDRTGKDPDDAFRRKAMLRVVSELNKTVTIKGLSPGVGFFGAYPTPFAIERRIMDIPASHLNDIVLDAPKDFMMQLYREAVSTPGVTKQGVTFTDWVEQNRGKLNAAIIADKRGASAKQIHDIITGGK